MAWLHTRQEVVEELKKITDLLNSMPPETWACLECHTVYPKNTGSCYCDYESDYYYE